jgi:hypothetical protein
MKRRLDLTFLIPFAVLLAWWQWEYRGYVKDDAYISLRYARNLVEGHGLVFNHGDRLEGYTNFLWILLSTPAFVLGIDPLSWVKGLGCLFGQVGLVVTYAIARFFGGDRNDWASFVAPALWASSTSVVLWSMGGLEPTLMAVVGGGGTLFAMRAYVAEDPSLARRYAIFSALLLAAASLCRPDANAIFLVAAGFVGLQALRKRGLARHWLLWGAVFLAIVGPYHLWRLVYFGDLIPNTAYVKAGAGPEVWSLGVEYVRNLLGFNVNPAVFILALAAPLAPRHRIVKIWGLVLIIAYLLYLVKIGRDEMKYFRLFLPVYPIALGLAADGLRNLVDAAVRAAGETPRARVVAIAVAAVFTWSGVVLCVDFTSSKREWNSNFVPWSQNSFQAMGAYVAERSEPGTVAVFQDMGGAPWTSPDVVWIDTIGILNRFVAHELASIGLNPFMRRAKRTLPGGAQEIRDFDDRVREYCFEQDPDWVAFIAYVGKPQKRRAKFARDIAKAERSGASLERLFSPRLKSNGHAHGMYQDPRFARDFEYVKYWKRNAGYWVVLFRKKGADSE